MKNWLHTMNNIGVDEDSDYLEVIKTRMVNQQTFYGVILCAYFAIRAIGEADFWIPFVALIATSMVFFFNYIRYQKTARLYWSLFYPLVMVAVCYLYGEDLRVDYVFIHFILAILIFVESVLLKVVCTLYIFLIYLLTLYIYNNLESPYAYEVLDYDKVLFYVISILCTANIVYVVFDGMKTYLSQFVEQSRELQIKNTQLEQQNLELEKAEQNLRDYNSELTHLNQRLTQKNAQLEEFTYIASHDLREPLRAINNLTNYLSTQQNDSFDERTSTSIQYLGELSSRMSKLVVGLMNFARIGRSNKIEEVNCNQLVTDVLKNLEVAIEESKASFKIETLPTLQGYEMELSQLFQNLISNAIKYRKKEIPVLIEIKVDSKPNSFEFSIRDNGIGVAPKHTRKIFQMFQRLHSRKTYEGIGIGLAHCKRIVELHNGEIWVESEEGIGSTFLFTIINTNTQAQNHE